MYYTLENNIKKYISVIYRMTSYSNTRYISNQVIGDNLFHHGCHGSLTETKNL